MKVVSVELMRQIERASDAAGNSYAQMMEKAGRAVADAVSSRADVVGKHVLVLVGPGNNGGDGLVAARHLWRSGAEVVCYLLKPRDLASDDNYRSLVDLGVPVVDSSDGSGALSLGEHLFRADIVIDGLLGTGTKLPLRDDLAQTLALSSQVLARRASPPFGVAVDGPTGLDFDTGEISGLALRAHLTVTFAHPKTGHYRFPGAAALGELVVADIGTDPGLAAESQLEAVEPGRIGTMLPSRRPDAHKGTFGKALIVAGCTNYVGAAYLAGAAATRVGAGLVTVALPSSIHTAIASRLAEATYLLLASDLGGVAPAASSVVAARANEYDALLIGPGLGSEKGTIAFLDALLGWTGVSSPIGFPGAGQPAQERTPLPPMILDADGLNILSQMSDWHLRLPSESILTPHPGEMARLMGCPTSEVEADRVAVAVAQASRWGHVVVLKGAHTVVAAPDGRAAIQPFANAGLATAGTGDVLAGAIVGLRAQRLGAFEAAVVGSYLHGLAGELARDQQGAAGMVAGDLIPALAQAIRLAYGP